MLSVIAQKKSKLNSIDIKTESLQGENIDRELYVLPTKEANTDKIWLLKKCTYRLVDYQGNGITQLNKYYCL